MGCANTKDGAGKKRCHPAGGKDESEKSKKKVEKNISKIISNKDWKRLSKLSKESPDVVASVVSESDLLVKVMMSTDVEFLKIIKEVIPSDVFTTTNSTGKTPLIALCSEAIATSESVLIFANKEHLELQDNEGETAFSKAAMRGNIPVLKTLLSLGSNPNTRNQCGETPLFLAIERNYGPTVEYLLSIPIDLSIVDDFGKTAFDLAKEEQPELVKLFPT